MKQDTSNIKKLGDYFNERVQESNNSLYANGYSGERNDITINERYAKIFAELNKIVNVLPGEKVLDVGCGTGEILSRLSAITEGAMGIDLSEEMVKLARQKGLHVEKHNGGTLPFDNDFFDCIFIHHVITNLPSLEIVRNLIEEAARVVNQNGRIFIGNIPHPKKSGMPTHSGNWRTCLKKLLGIKQPINYFSYKYSFFTEEFDRLDFSRISYFPGSTQIPTWDSKYHLLLNR